MYIWISEKYKTTKTIAMMITEDKVTEIFCMADDFCKIETVGCGGDDDHDTVPLQRIQVSEAFLQ